MTSELKVDAISNAAGTSALNIDSSGRVSKSVVPYALVDWGGNAYVTHNTGNFDNAVVNDGNHYNTTNGEFTCPVDGLYLCVAHFLRQDDAGATTEAQLHVNGTKVYRAYSKNRSVSAQYVHKASAGDVIKWGSISNANYYEGTGTNRYSYASFTFLG